MSALTTKHFNSQIQDHGVFGLDIPKEWVKNEPMFFNSSTHFAYCHGNAITRNFIDSLPAGWHDDVVFDSRVHMLMPGWYPAIPGWHHDDVPRPEIPVGQHFITAGQPDYDTPRYHSEHIMGLINAEVCPTEFAIGECDMPPVAPGELIYRGWNDVVNNLIADKILTKVSAASNRLIGFNCNTFHTGVKAIGNGWRWFGRVSRNTERTKKLTNEIRHQVQVYLEFPMEGW